MSKIHWNTVNAEYCPTKQLKELIDHSYLVVILGLPKKLKLNFDLIK